MKKYFNYFVPCILLILIIVNALIIVSGLKLSGEIYRFEIQTKNIKKQNSELEKKNIRHQFTSVCSFSSSTIGLY